MSIVVSSSEEQKELEKHDPQNILFSDPLREETRKIRRNFLFLSCVAIVIETFGVALHSYMGLQVSIMPPMLYGMLALGLIYFLISFLLYLVVDYLAWDFKRELQNITPYTNIIQGIKSGYERSQKELELTVGTIDKLLNSNPTPDVDYIKDDLGRIYQLLKTIDFGPDRYGGLQERVEEWHRSVLKMNRLNLRKTLRLTALWRIDIGVPLFLCAIALFKTATGVLPLMHKIFS